MRKTDFGRGERKRAVSNNAKKGTEIELKAKKKLEAEGWLVHRTIRNPILVPGKGLVGSHNNDVFGVFDLIAAKADQALKLIQVTTSGEVRKRQKKVETVVDSMPDTVDVEVWGWVGGRKRIDSRYKHEKIFVRRQYFRMFQWIWPDWEDVTDPEAGKID